jgi:DNA-binding LacI/PurR family transcriptional regulator
MTNHLIQKGYRKLAVLMRDRMFRGDHDLVDSVRNTAAAAGIDLASLTLRCLPADANAVASTVAELLSQSPGEPLGVICRSEPLALGVELAARERNLTIDKDVSLTLSDVYRKGSDSPPRWPYLKPTLTPEQIGQHIGRMLALQALGKPVEPDHELIPVYLKLPESAK